MGCNKGASRNSGMGAGGRRGGGGVRYIADIETYFIFSSIALQSWHSRSSVHSHFYHINFIHSF